MWKLCKKFGHFIIKIIKFVATRCQILRLKCTKFNFGSPRPSSRNRGVLLLRGGGKGGEAEGGGGEEGKGAPHFLLTTLTTASVCKIRGEGTLRSGLGP